MFLRILSKVSIPVNLKAVVYQVIQGTEAEPALFEGLRDQNFHIVIV